MRNETRGAQYLETGPELETGLELETSLEPEEGNKLGLLDNDNQLQKTTDEKSAEEVKTGLDEDSIIKVASEIAQKEEEAESDEEDSSLTYVAIGAAVAALGYTAYSYWPAITAAVSSAITWTASVAIPAISAFALTSTGMITGMAVLGILLFGAIAYMKMSGKSEPLPPVVDPIPPVVDPIKENAATKIQSIVRMNIAKNHHLFKNKEFWSQPLMPSSIIHDAATKIQSSYRMHVAKKEDASVKAPVAGK